MGFFKQPFLLDGATGTNLYLAGMPNNVCVEKWVLENPGPIQELQRRYAENGSDAVMAPTFGANRVGLSRYGLGDKVGEFNKRLVALSRDAVGGKALVAGDMSPTGLFIEPYGTATFDDLLGIFSEQARALRAAGADYLAIETFMNLTEARAALLASKETGLPVTVTLTVDEHGRTLSGGNVLPCLLTLASMGADAVGLNCSTGPEIILKELRDAAGMIPAPLIAKPNAGLPRDGVYSLSPEDFAAYAPEFLKAGVGILGGCCGTVPEHIRRLKEAVSQSALVPLPARGPGAAATSERRLFPIDEQNVVFSGELACDDDLAENALELDPDEYSCALIRLNGMEDAREFGISYNASLPPAFAAEDAAVLEAALKLYQGRAVIRGGTGVPRRELERMAKKYGAVIE